MTLKRALFEVTVLGKNLKVRPKLKILSWRPGPSKWTFASPEVATYFGVIDGNSLSVTLIPTSENAKEKKGMSFIRTNSDFNARFPSKEIPAFKNRAV